MNFFSYFFCFVSAGKQATHKNPEEYAEPSVEWNADISWNHCSRHDHQNAQVGLLAISLWPAISTIPQTAKWPVYYAGDEDPCFQSPSELPAAVHASHQAFPGNSLFQPGQRQPTVPLAVAAVTAQVLAAQRISAPSFPQRSPYGVIEVKRSHLGPKSLTHSCHPACVSWFRDFACVFVCERVRAAYNQCQFAQQIHNRVGWYCLSWGNMSTGESCLHHTHKCRQSGVCLSSCVYVKGNHWQERTCMAPPLYVEKTHTQTTHVLELLQTHIRK